MDCVDLEKDGTSELTLTHNKQDQKIKLMGDKEHEHLQEPPCPAY